MANGSEFKGYIENIQKKPEIICVQETWLNATLDFVIKGYDSVHKRYRRRKWRRACYIFKAKNAV